MAVRLETAVDGIALHKLTAAAVLQVDDAAVPERLEAAVEPAQRRLHHAGRRRVTRD